MLKRIRIIAVWLIAAILFITGGAGIVYGQKIEKKVGGKIYVFDYNKKKIYNKASSITQDFATDGYTVKQNTIVPDVFRKVIEAKRFTELKGETVTVSFVCRADGSVESVNFRFRNTPSLTPEEINRLETQFLARSFSITTESGIERVGFSYHFRF